MIKANDRVLRACIGLGVVLVAGCGGGGGSGPGGGSSRFTIVEASNGFGRMLPHQIPIRNAQGNPTSRVIEIDTIEDLVQNVTPANPILAPTEWPTAKILPNNEAGNHFIYVRFSQPIDIASVLTPSTSAATDSNLTGAINIVAVDAGGLRNIRGRAFVGGKSYGPGLDPNNPENFALEQWVKLENGNLVANEINGQRPGLGFPGTEGVGFAGDDVLVDPATFVFVIDEDSDLELHETFPVGTQIQMRINGAVHSTFGRELRDVGLAVSTVGPDSRPPAVVVSGSPATPAIVPPRGETDVDPETNIEITFTEPVQILTVGNLDDGKAPRISPAIQLVFGPERARVEVPFFVRPFSVYDLSRLELVPAYAFPGSGPELGGDECSDFDQVSVNVEPGQFTDLNGHLNEDGADSNFFTREGPGIVNAPVMPDVVYIGRGGANPGISVIDLYGFGGGTGNPTYDDVHPIKEGNTNFPNNRNVKLQSALLIPPLERGTCTVNGGSEGVFTLTKDSSLDDMVVRSPLIESVGDMAIGHALDTTFNNAAPFGCQSGGGNLCASNSLKRVQLTSGGPNALAPSTTSTQPTKIVTAGENLMLFSPHPNPPPLTFPPLCLSPLINSLEPTSGDTSLPPPRGNALVNLMVPGQNFLGKPLLNQPPTTLIPVNQHSFFDGPSPPQPLVALCNNLVATRQQIGHFLYVVDRVAGEVVVFNSNRFTVIDRITLPDPTSLAMSPNIDLLAVTNEGADQVSFIDIDPSSSSFHQVVRSVTVGAGPTGIAWESGNEDIFVCNQAEGTVTILSAFTLRPRKVLRNQLTEPIEVAITPRQLGFGFGRGIYFAYILNQNGTVAFFESGPDGLNGWGFDDCVGSLPFSFFKPKTIQPDVTRLNSGVWLLHERPLDVDGNWTGEEGGALTSVGIASAARGILTITAAGAASPQIRNMEFGIFGSVGEGDLGLSGVPVDVATDSMANITALNNYSTQFSAGQPLSINGKSLLRFSGGTFAASTFPQYLFVAVPNPGVVDVLELSTGTLSRVDTNVFRPNIQSIPATNASVVVDYMRQ